MTEEKKNSEKSIHYLGSLNKEAFNEPKEIRATFLKNWLIKIKDNFISLIK